MTENVPIPYQSGNPPTPFNVIQAGQNNTNIGSVENAFATTILVATNTPTASQPSVLRQLDMSCYHLFVVGGEDFTKKRLLIDPSRALTEYISDEIRMRYQHLEPELHDELQSYPALFMSENKGSGKASSDQQALLGYVTDIRVQDNGVRIGYETFGFPIQQQDLNENAHLLGIKTRGRMSELNRTHWTLKRVNLVEAFNEAGINLLPIRLPQGGILQ